MRLFVVVPSLFKKLLTDRLRDWIIQTEQPRNNGDFMSSKPFTANLSRSQGRSAWSVIFRHPARPDPNTKKMGLRVRQGLGTDDEQKAAHMVQQLNQLLADSAFHDPRARADAEKRFDPRVVEIFYYGMVAEEADFGAVRDAVIGLPSSKNSPYRRALMLGTTGAGKTTLLRQIMCGRRREYACFLPT